METLRGFYERGLYREGYNYYRGMDGDHEWHWYGSLCAWKADLLIEARSAAEKGLQDAPADWRVKLTFQRGDMCRRIGDLHDAHDSFTTCLSLLDGSELAPILKGATLYNLALTLSDQGKDGLDYYEQALAEFEREGMQDYQRMCLQNMAWLMADRERWDDAHTLLDRAATLCRTPDALQYQKALLAHVAFREGDVHTALKFAESILDRTTTEGDVPVPVTTIAATIVAEVGLRQSNLDAALHMAKFALDLASRYAQDHRCWRMAQKVYQQAARLKEAGA